MHEEVAARCGAAVEAKHELVEVGGGVPFEGGALVGAKEDAAQQRGDAMDLRQLPPAALRCAVAVPPMNASLPR